MVCWLSAVLRMSARTPQALIFALSAASATSVRRIDFGRPRIEDTQILAVLPSTIRLLQDRPVLSCGDRRACGYEGESFDNTKVSRIVIRHSERNILVCAMLVNGDSRPPWPVLR